MNKTTIASALIAASMIAAPAVADDSEIIVARDNLPVAANNDTNSFWLDYTTDISEAKRELASDLERATDDEDRREAYGEYYLEVRDARADYREEMNERGYVVVDFNEDGIDIASLR